MVVVIKQSKYLIILKIIGVFEILRYNVMVLNAHFQMHKKEKKAFICILLYLICTFFCYFKLVSVFPSNDCVDKISTTAHACMAVDASV